MTYWGAVGALTNIVFSFPVEDDLMSQAAQWGFLDPQPIERVFQQQCLAILPIFWEEFCCWLQLVRTVKNLFTRVAFIWSGLESVMYFSWGYTLRHSRNGREWGYLLIKYGGIILFKKILKKSVPKLMCDSLPIPSACIFPKCTPGQHWGLWENIEKAGQRAKMVIIAQSGFTLEMINRFISILGWNFFLLCKEVTLY